jgi:hypothetical protein
MSFRFLIQPAVAIFFAIRAGLKDAQQGQPPLLWSLLTLPSSRRERGRQIWKDVGKVFIVVLILDSIYQSGYIRESTRWNCGSRRRSWPWSHILSCAAQSRGSRELLVSERNPFARRQTTKHQKKCVREGPVAGSENGRFDASPQKNSMRVLLAQVSILTVCVLAVSAAPARSQSLTLTSDAGSRRNVPAVKTGDAPTKTAGDASSTASLEEMQATINRLEKRVNELEDRLNKGATDATSSVVAPKAVKEDAVEETVKPMATATNTDVGAVAPQNIPATQRDLSWTKGDFRIEPFGAVRLDATYNSARVQGPGMPAFLVPQFVGGFSQRTTAINARNSMIGVLFTGPDIGNFHSGGRISAVFFDNTNVFADNNGFLLTQSYGELFTDKWRFAAGLQLDVFAPNLPTVLPFSADGAPGGNTIKGQIRVERFLKLGSNSQLTLQGALSEPLNSIKTPDVSLDEDNGWPNVEGRIAFGLGNPARIGLLTQRPLEVGVSGVGGQLRRTSLPSDPPRRVVSDVWGASFDFRVNLASRYGFKGEMYTGQGLGQMGAGILQTLDAVTWKAIRSTGGWVEGYVYLTPNLHSHTGLIIDDPNNNDITALPNTLFGRTYNRIFFSTLLWDLGGETKKFRIGAEFTLRKTEYKDPIATGRLPNSGFGINPQFQWLF